MPKLEPILRAELDPRNPVPEICGVIDGVLSFHPFHARVEILRGLQKAVDESIAELSEMDQKGEDQNVRHQRI